MREFVVYTVSGLTTGGVYAIFASGLTLTYATTGVFNFAHGAIGMLAAFVFWQLREAWHWPTSVALLVVVVLLAPLFGAVVERSIMRRLDGAPELSKLVATVALMLGLVALALWVWDPTVDRGIRPFWSGRALVWGVLRVPYHDLVVLGVSVVGVALLSVFLHATREGIAMRAQVDSRPLAELCGARPWQSARIAWVLGCGSAALAGILVAPKLTLSPLPITLLIVNAYAAAAIGGLRNLPLTVAGAVGLGLVNDYAVGYIPKIHTGQQYLRGVVSAMPVLVLFGALLVLGRQPQRQRVAPASAGSAARRLTYRQIAVLSSASVLVTVAFAYVLGVGDLLSATRVWGLAIVALSLVPLVGVAGKVSLCQLTFGGIGAVVAAHLGAHGNPITLVWAAVVAAAIGALVALPTRRLSGIYLALATAAFAVVMDRWVFGLPGFTVFGHEVTIFRTGSLDVRRPRLGPLDLASDRAFFIATAVAFAVCAFVVASVLRGRFGRRLFALRDSERGAQSAGVNTGALTVVVFAGSAAMAGFGGALYGMAIGSVSAERFDFVTSVSIVLVMVVAGLQSPAAAVFAGVFLGGPALTNLFPHLTQLSSVLVALSAIAVGRNANGFVVDVVAPWWARARQRRRLAGATGAALGGLWVARVAGAMNNWSWGVASIGVLGVFVAVTSGGWRTATRKAVTPDDRVPVERWGLDAGYSADGVAWLDGALALERAYVRR